MAYNLGTASGRIIIDGSGASKGFNTAGAAMSGFFNVVDARLRSIKNLGQNMAKIGAIGTTGFGLAINAAANFEQRLSAIQAISGATVEEMEQISKTALRIGKDTAYSATESASAMEELIKAGLSVQDVLNGAADATVNLAAAGEVALPEAAEIAANAMNNFRLSGEDMPRIADLIAGAANASAISVSEFGMSLQQGGAVAAIAGLKFDDLAVAIAEMGNAGIKGSDAGTSLKTFLMNLIPVTDRQVEKFRELGLLSINTGKALKLLASEGIKPANNGFMAIEDALAKYVEKTMDIKVGSEKSAKAVQELAMQTGVLENQFFNANGEVKSLADVQQVLKDVTKGMTEEQKLANLELLFGSDAIRAAAVLSRDGAKGYNEMAKAMGKVTAADVAATRLDNLKGSLEELSGSVETAMITIGQVFLPVVRKIVDALVGLVNVFNNLPAPVQKAIAIILGIVTAITTLIGVAITLAFALAPLVVNFVALFVIRQLIAIIMAGAAAMMSGAGAAGIYAAAMTRAQLVVARFVRIGKIFIVTAKLMRAAWLIMTGPIGIAIAVVLALVAAGKLLYDRWVPFRNLVDQISAAIKNKFNAAMRELNRWVQMVIAGFQGFKSADGGFYEFLFRIGAIARTVWEGLLRIGEAFRTSVLPALREAGGNIMSAFVEAWRNIVDTFKTQIIPAFRSLGLSIKNDLWPALMQLREALRPFAETVLKAIAVAVVVVVAALFKLAMIIVQYVIPAVITVVSWLVSKLAPVFQVIVQALTFLITWLIKLGTVLVEAVSAAIQFVSDIISRGMTAVKNVITTVVTAIVSFWKAAWAIFGPLIKAVWDLIVSIVKLGIATVKVTISNALKVIKSIWETVWGGIKKYASAVWNAIKSVVTSVVNTVKSAIKNAWSAVDKFTDQHFGGVKKAISDNMAKAEKIVSDAIAAIKRFFSGAKTWLLQAGKDIIQGLIDGITARTKSLTDKISDVASKVKSITASIMQLGSPSRVFYKIGTQIMDGWINGIKAGAPKLYDYMVKFEKRIANLKVSKTKKSSIEKLVKSYTTSLTKLNTSLDKVRDKLKTANDEYARLIEQAKQYAESIRAATVGNITSIRNNGESVLVASQVVKQLEDRYNAARDFLFNIQKLRDAGLDEEFLQQILEAGVDGGAEMAAAIAADLSSISTINNLQSSLSAIGNALGAIGVREFHQTGIDIAKGIVDGLKSQESVLVKAVEALAKKMIAALKKSLKIKSPSRVTQDVGIDTAMGFAKGLDSQRRYIERMSRSISSASLAAMMSPSRRTPVGVASYTRPGSYQTAPSTSETKVYNITNNTYNPLPERESESTNKKLQDLSVMGII